MDTRESLLDAVRAGADPRAAVEQLRVELDDPAFTSQLVSDPALMVLAVHGRLDDRSVRAVLRAADEHLISGMAMFARFTSPRSVGRLARFPKWAVGTAVATRPDLPVRSRAVVALVGAAPVAAAAVRVDRSWPVRIVSFLRRPLPVAVARVEVTRSKLTLFRCAHSTHFPMLLAVAMNPRAGRITREVLIMRRTMWGHHLPLAGRPDLSADEYLRLSPHPAVLLELAANQAVPAEVIEVIRANRVEHGADPFVLALADTHPTVPADVRLDQATRADLAWVYQRMLRDPALPPEIDEQIRVWLALGGGRGDPNFDPVRCTGRPGDGTRSRMDEYRGVASDRSMSSLWPTRAMAYEGVQRLGRDVIDLLAYDGAAGVRRVAATYRSAPHLRRLVADPDPTVVEAAERTIRTSHAPTSRMRLRRVPRDLFRVRSLWILVAILLMGLGLRWCSTRPADSSPASTVRTGQPDHP